MASFGSRVLNDGLHFQRNLLNPLIVVFLSPGASGPHSLLPPLPLPLPPPHRLPPLERPTPLPLLPPHLSFLVPLPSRPLLPSLPFRRLLFRRLRLQGMELRLLVRFQHIFSPLAPLAPSHPPQVPRGGLSGLALHRRLRQHSQSRGVQPCDTSLPGASADVGGMDGA